MLLPGDWLLPGEVLLPDGLKFAREFEKLLIEPEALSSDDARLFVAWASISFNLINSLF